MPDRYKIKANVDNDVTNNYDRNMTPLAQMKTIKKEIKLNGFIQRTFFMHCSPKLCLQKEFVTLIENNIMSKKLAWSNSIINLFIGHVLWNSFRWSVRFV